MTIKSVKGTRDPGNILHLNKHNRRGVCFWSTAHHYVSVLALQGTKFGQAFPGYCDSAMNAFTLRGRRLSSALFLFETNEIFIVPIERLGQYRD